MLSQRKDNKFRAIVESAGAVYRGVQYDLQDTARLVLFDEPKYHSTVSVRVDNVTKRRVKKVLYESLLRYSITKREETICV